MSGNSKGFLERISWLAIIGAIISALGIFFAFPDYLLNIRPQIANVIGFQTLSFVEGTIFGTVVTVLVLKVVSERGKNKEGVKETQSQKKPRKDS